MDFPSVCPEIPVSDLPAGLVYYRDKLGFTIDWADEEIGLAGLSRGGARMFMSNAGYHSHFGTQGALMLWLNLDDRTQIDALHAEWSGAGALIDSPPEPKPYKLYEFYARDPDGNRWRVFYDFGWEEREAGG